MAAAGGSSHKPPADLVAAFHTTFHATQGNIISWSKTALPSIKLEGVEFTALPAGLHQLDSDVIYLTRDGYRGVCVFQRRKSDEPGMRGYRLESVGILVANTPGSYPWRHLPALKELARKVADRGKDLEPVVLEQWFNARRMPIQGEVLTEDELSWEEELSDNPTSHPLLHLPHLLRILGPSALTLYKHVLARRRVLIYAQPPVEPACILAYIASDLCFGGRPASERHTYLAGPPTVLGMVTLSDFELLQSESWRGAGWIACTTEAIFMEKPYLYDLLVDMSTANWTSQARPTLYMSRMNPSAAGTRKPSHKLYPVRFTWSDVRLWNELDRILRGDPTPATPMPLPTEESYADPTAPPFSRGWTDPWRMYEDACVVCASVWLMSARPAPRLEGSDDLNVRQRGRGIEGGPPPVSPPPSPMKVRRRGQGIEGVLRGPPMPTPVLMDDEVREEPPAQIRTTLALLNVFHTHTGFLLTQLDTVLGEDGGEGEVVLTARDVMALELGPLSDMDARFVAWLAGRGGRRVVVRRSWRDLLAAVFGIVL